jgi:F0F1-type ATP synthase assembly protein I
MTISLEMVLPGLAGYWLDQKFGTKALFMLVGFALGGTLAFWHLLHLTGQAETSRSIKNSIKDKDNEGEEEK